MENISKVGFGGGCHWCTEAVFQALHGVIRVEQGWIASTAPNDHFSEGVIVHFDAGVIPFAVLTEIHLLTHSSSSEHSMRAKYRSAVYYFEDRDGAVLQDAIERLARENDTHYITKILRFMDFRPNADEQQNYYLKNRKAPFCQMYISPKLMALRNSFSARIKEDF